MGPLERESSSNHVQPPPHSRIISVSVDTAVVLTTT
jgi:hypothetical protein